MAAHAWVYTPVRVQLTRSQASRERKTEREKEKEADAVGRESRVFIERRHALGVLAQKVRSHGWLCTERVSALFAC